MAKNITLLGATYSNCPAILLPQSGGGTARFDDASVTTAVASDVASGKVFLASDGTITTGTNSGGGGSSNYVSGTFTPSGSGTVGSFTIPYSGGGYPICAMVFIKGGANNPNDGGWHDTIQRYAVGQWTMSKAIIDSPPTYNTGSTANYGVTTAIYKNSTSNAAVYTRTSSMTTSTFSSSDASNEALTCVRFKTGNVMSYYTASKSYGLLSGVKYEYHVIFSE